MSAMASKTEVYLHSLELPEELKQVPRANVGFVGLNPKNSEIHKQILDAFTASRATDRLGIHYSIIAADTEFPPAKAKRTTYEWFLPKGILKRQWMKKHLFELPAVVIIFFDLDWGEQAWNEKMLECSSRVKAIRAALTSQQTRLAVVLVQRAAAGDDPQAADRAAELCGVCDLPPKSLWVLPTTGHLNQYAMRLESAFHELAQTYYHQRVKAIQGHRELLNKSHHQALFVRHQFKLGFFSEIRQDMVTAYKAYQQAYSHLLELPTTDLTLCEIKVVAAMLRFKVCRLAFRQNLPRDAIAYFRRHVDLFRDRVGPPDLAVEHCGWLGQQYQWFGEVFDQAIQMGLPAIQTQHPGLYFEQAAVHGKKRRLAAEALHLVGHRLIWDLYMSAADYPDDDPLAVVLSTDFYGQRPWRPPGRNVELMDTEKERRGLLAIQVMECCVNHHNLVIPLLSSAISHYKKYHCPRMKERLLVQMAEEYTLSGDHDKAVILLGKVLLLYLSERWWPLVIQVASLGLRSAYLSCQVEPYLTMAAALLSAAVPGSQQERRRIDANIHRILTRQPPEPEPGCAQVSGWLTSLATADSVTLELPDRDTLLACSATFSAATYQQGSPLQVEVRLRNLTGSPLPLAAVRVTVSGRSAETAGGGLLPAGEQRHLTVQVPARLEELGSVVWLQTLSADVAQNDCLHVQLVWKLNFGDEQLHQSMFRLPVDSPHSDVDGLCATVVPRPARLALDAGHRPPVLVGEVYRLTVLMTCDDLGSEVTDLKVDVSLVGADEETGRNTFVIYEDTSQPLSEPLSVSCDTVAPGAARELQLAVQCLTPASRQLQLAARYSEVTEAGTCQGRVAEVIPLDVVHPFQMSVRPLALTLDPVEVVGTGQTVLLVAQITNTGPHAVRLRRTQLAMDEAMFEVADGSDEDESGEAGAAAVRDLQLQPMESATECVSVTARDRDGKSEPGTYTVTWNRLDWNDRPVGTVAPSPSLVVRSSPLLVSVSVPAHGVVRTPLTACYTVSNHSQQVYTLLLHMEASEAFMFAGNKRYQFRVVPGGSRQLTYNLYPLLSGRVTLPQPRLTLYRDGVPVEAAELIDGALRHLPTHIYVMEKGGPHGGLPVVDGKVRAV